VAECEGFRNCCNSHERGWIQAESISYGYHIIIPFAPVSHALFWIYSNSFNTQSAKVHNGVLEFISRKNWCPSSSGLKCSLNKFLFKFRSVGTSYTLAVVNGRYQLLDGINHCFISIKIVLTRRSLAILRFYEMSSVFIGYSR